MLRETISPAADNCVHPGQGEPSALPPAEREIAPATEGEVQGAKRHIDDLGDEWSFVTASPAMERIRQVVRRIVDVELPVLISGESGTGKEMVARFIHKQSFGIQQSFTKINCAAFSPEFFAIELSGCALEAYRAAGCVLPDADQKRRGKTLFLEEIEKMPLPMQARLLGLLEQAAFPLPGEIPPASAGLRLIASTSVDLQALAERGRFRADLYHRLNVLHIRVPALRERQDDIPALLDHFLEVWSARYGRPLPRVSPTMLKLCNVHSWPGNVRELENLVKSYLVLGNEREAIVGLGSAAMVTGPSDESLRQSASECSREMRPMVQGVKRETERRIIVRALELAKGSRKETARLLQINLRTLNSKIREYRIEARGSQPSLTK